MIEIQKVRDENQEKLKNIWKRAESEISLSFGSKCGFAAFFMGMVITLVLVAGVEFPFSCNAIKVYNNGSKQILPNCQFILIKKNTFTKN